MVVFAGGQSAPAAVVSDGALVFWSTADGAVRTACEKPNPAIITLATKQGSIHAIAVDDKAVYWSTDSDSGPRIMRAKPL